MVLYIISNVNRANKITLVKLKDLSKVDLVNIEDLVVPAVKYHTA